MTNSVEPIAIIGLGGVFPDAPDVPTFARNMLAGRSAIRDVPEGRWIVDPRIMVTREFAVDRAYAARGGFVETFELDVAELAVDRELLAQLDPLYHLTLAAGQQAWRDAVTANLDRARVGVALAAIALPTDASSAITRETLGRDFARRLLSSSRDSRGGSQVNRDSSGGIHTHPLNAQVTALPASLLASALQLGGGSFTLDAACASSLYAIKLACDDLRAGRLDAVLAGGVSRPECLYTQVGFSQLRALSPSGACRPFDAAADGLIVGEGAGIVVLKRVDDALAAGDRIYGVIRGIGLTNDIAGSLLAADSEGQLRAMRQAYAEAGWSPSDVDYIECHGTGTPLGDAVEFSSMRALWGESGWQPNQCVIGSAKSLVGHLLTGAAAAGLVRTLVAMNAKRLPPTANFRSPSPGLEMNRSPFRVLGESAEWTLRNVRSPRRAAVSAFGFGGINAHLLVEEFVPADETQASVARRLPKVATMPFSVDPNGKARSAAIVGMAIHIGQVDSLQEFQELLASGRSALASPPSDRWRGCDRFLESLPGGYIDAVRVRPGEFRIPPNEIAEALPQQLLMLQVAARALDDAGLPRRAHRPRMGVVIGISLDLNTSNFHHRWCVANRAREWAGQLGIELTDEELAAWIAELQGEAHAPLNAGRVQGALGGLVASRVAREFGCGGPSFGVSAGEASGLRALDIARRALAADEVDEVLVGAVDFAGDVRSVLTTCAAHSAHAPADGAVAVVLTRAGDAERAGARIFAYVRGLGFASGKPMGRLESAYPNRDRMPLTQKSRVKGEGVDQIEALQRACADAGISASDIARSLEGADHSDLTASVGCAGAAAGLVSIVAACSAPQRFAPRADSRSPESFLASVGTNAFDGTRAQAVLEIFPQALRNARVEREDTPRADANLIVVPTGGPALNPRPPRSGRRRRIAPVGQSAVAQHLADASPLVVAVAESAMATASAHESYLKFAHVATAGLESALQLQARLLAAGAMPTDRIMLKDRIVEPVRRVAYSRELCMEFAVGLVAKVLGPEFAEVDSFPVRVRLPDEPLMLVDRILEIEGEKNSLTSGRLVTEHDVRPGDWYLDGGAMPVSITVESGQADLFLCAYLGIDLRVRGRRAYRLLDATVRFHRHLPRPGEVVRYDIRISRFVRQGETYLFFFEFDGTVDGRPVLTMRDGCAGFFTTQEIRDSGGIIETAAEREPQPRSLPQDWRPLAPLAGPEAYSEAQVDALRRGDLVACFGESFSRLTLDDAVRLPGGRMRLVHRVVTLDPAGGRYGLGLIRAEADIHADDWFLTCHFVDDMVMPGTLMYECCMHTLRILLMRMGWLAEQDRVCYEPIPGIASALRCRGPVTAATRVVTYEVHVKQLGYGYDGSDSAPFAIADALMYADGEKIVRFTDMSVKLSGVTRAQVEQLWSSLGAPFESNAGCHAHACEGMSDAAVSCEKHGHASVAMAPNDTATARLAVSPGDVAPAIEPIGDSVVPSGPKSAVYDRDRILAFAIGKPSEAFGEPYRVFDQDRRIARLPGPPYQVLDRITQANAEPWKLTAEGWIEGQYDVPRDAWYFAANRQPTMPFAVLLEVALQPCGWLAAYKGSALTSAQDLRFRNLGGTATLYEEITPRAGTLTTRVRLTRVSRAGGMIIQDYDMQVWRQGRCVYDGQTAFGFFTDAALAQQVGIRDAAARRYQPEGSASADHVLPENVDYAPFAPDDLRSEAAIGLALPARALRMIDEVTCWLPDGGPHGLGYIRGIKRVDPAEWFFAAHFFQDPVCPGSLGLESFLQLLKYVAMNRWGARLARTHRFTPIELRAAHTWTYRGQVIPANREVTVEAAITDIVEGESPTIRANGFLSVDGVTIYEIADFGISLVPK